jgi:hypothetical protein
VQVETPKLLLEKSEDESESDADGAKQTGFSTPFGAAKDEKACLRWTTWEHLVQLAAGCGINRYTCTSMPARVSQVD